MALSDSRIQIMPSAGGMEGREITWIRAELDNGTEDKHHELIREHVGPVADIFVLEVAEAFTPRVPTPPIAGQPSWGYGVRCRRPDDPTLEEQSREMRNAGGSGYAIVDVGVVWTTEHGEAGTVYLESTAYFTQARMGTEAGLFEGMARRRSIL